MITGGSMPTTRGFGVSSIAGTVGSTHRHAERVFVTQSKSFSAGKQGPISFSLSLWREFDKTKVCRTQAGLSSLTNSCKHNDGPARSFKVKLLPAAPSAQDVRI